MFAACCVRMVAGCGIVGAVGVSTPCVGALEEVPGVRKSHDPTGVVLEVRRMRVVYGCTVSPFRCGVVAGVALSAHGVMCRTVIVSCVSLNELKDSCRIVCMYGLYELRQERCAGLFQGQQTFNFLYKVPRSAVSKFSTMCETKDEQAVKS